MLQRDRFIRIAKLDTQYPVAAEFKKAGLKVGSLLAKVNGVYRDALDPWLVQTFLSGYPDNTLEIEWYSGMGEKSSVSATLPSRD